MFKNLLNSFWNIFQTFDSYPAFAKVCLSFLFAGLPYGKLQATQIEGQVGFRYGSLQDELPYEERPYLRFGFEHESSDLSKLVRGQFRLSANQLMNEQEEEYELRPEELSIHLNHGSSRFSFGLMRVTWGETFGIPILDIVNVWDESQFILANPAEAKLPSWLFLYEWFGEKSSVQLLISPWNQHRVLEQSIKGEISQPRTEFGGRFSYLLPGNVDLKLYSFHHESRLPLVKINGLTGEMERVRHYMENSYGISLSYGLQSWVLRADALSVPEFYLNTAQASDPQKRERKTYTAGLDYTTDSQWNFGIQHSGGLLVSPLATEIQDDGRGLLGYQLMKSWWNDRIKQRLWYFHLAANHGRWLKLGVDANIGTNASLSLEWDSLQGDKLTAGIERSSIEHFSADIKLFF
ncbi:MAG: hypothetical protein ACOH5I_14515 [Oligoflexus sp.]